MGESYEFQMVICACPDGTVIMELLFEKKFEQEMRNQGMNQNLIKKVGSEVGVTATSPTVQQIVRTSGRQPPILGMIQQSLQNKAPNAQSVQYLTTARSFNVPPPQIPRFPAENSVRGKAPTIPRMPTTSSSKSPAASTPKKNKSKKGRKLLKKIIPLPQETSDDDQETTNDEGPRLQTHEYETLGEDSISEIEKERGSPVNLTASIVRMDNIEYVPVEKVSELVEDAVNRLLAEGIIVRANESSSESPDSPEKTVVQVDNEQAEEIQDISESIFQNQSTKEAVEKQNDESITEKGENSNPGPKTRSKSRSKGPE